MLQLRVGDTGMGTDDSEADRKQRLHERDQLKRKIYELERRVDGKDRQIEELKKKLALVEQKLKPKVIP
jgi:hypothetical protein